MTSRLDLRSRSLYALNGTRLEQRYELGPVLGTGGMGAVFKARHLRLDRPVAIKVLRPLLAEHDEYVERFLREAKAASKIRHRNVVEILDYGEAGGMVYSVMEFLVGKDLQGVLRAQPGQRLPWTTVCALLVQIASGLKAAHKHGVIHRDIKPANCFLTDEDDEPVIKVVDFGVAKLQDEQGQPLTGIAQVLGTPSYIAPEMFCSRTPANPRTDIYALGVLAYRMLTGRVPFRSRTFFDLMRQASQDDVPSMREQVPDIPPVVESFIRQMLAKDPDDRPPDMLTVRERLVALSQQTLGPQVVRLQGSSKLVVSAEGGPPPIGLADTIVSWDAIDDPSAPLPEALWPEVAVSEPRLDATSRTSEEGSEVESTVVVGAPSESTDRSCVPSQMPWPRARPTETVPALRDSTLRTGDLRLGAPLRRIGPKLVVGVCGVLAGLGILMSSGVFDRSTSAAAPAGALDGETPTGAAARGESEGVSSREGGEDSEAREVHPGSES